MCNGKKSRNSWCVWDILRSLTPQYNQKTSFFQGKNSAVTIMYQNPTSWKLGYLKKPSSYSWFRTGFSPTGKQTKTYMRQSKWGSTFFNYQDWTSEKNSWNHQLDLDSLQKTHWATSHQLLSCFLIYFFGLIFWGIKLRNLVPTNSFC